jgi:putative ABC transport system permease protein
MGWRRIFHRTRRDTELAKDIQFYLDAETEENIARGMPTDLARERARRKFGNPTLVREEVYRMNGPQFLETLWQDGLYGLRQLWRSPGFTAVAILTLTLGIGATAAIFSIVNSVLLQRLPYRDPGRLVWAAERFTLSSGSGSVLGPDYVAWQRYNQVFQQIEGFRTGPVEGPDMSLSGPGEPIPVRVTAVTVGFFSMLGVQPIAGRSFTADEGQEGRAHVLLISETLWHTQFGGSPEVLGRSFRLGDSAYAVVGVMPASIQYPQADVWTPVALNSTYFSPRSRPMATIAVVGRLKPDITLSQAESNLSQIAHSIDRNYPPQMVQSRDRRVELVPLHTLLVRNVRALLLILLGTVSFVFLIACANVANLSLSRAVVRSREFAIRASLGAGSARLVRQLLTESLLLAAIGSVLGLLCGLWSVRLLKRLIPPGLPTEIGLDPRILVFAIGIAILATLVFGLAPALAVSRAEVGETLKGAGVRAGGGGGTHRLRNILAISEIALSLILLIGAGLLARSFVRLSKVHLGFNPDHILTAQVRRRMTNGFQTPSQAPFFNEVLRNIRNLPGVKDVGTTDRAPLRTCEGMAGSIRLRGAASDLRPVCSTAISPDYFRTMEVPLLKGRSFSDRDSSDAPPVVMLNETLAREAFEGRAPVGQTVGVYLPTGISWRTVVGVVADTSNSTLEQQTWPEIFVPYPQALLPLFATLVLRTDGNPLALAGPLRKAVQAVDRNQSVSNIQSMDEVIESSTAPQWFRTLLLGLFALLALVLAGIGVYGVMAYTVSQRSREIGIRVALGAQPKNILVLTLTQGMFVTVAGLVVGVVGAMSLTRFLSSFLYDVKPTDLTTFLAALVLLAGTALFACYVPARRAARVDPLAALRNE